MKKHKNIRIAFEQTTALVTINRPDKLNALNRDTLSELSEAIDDLNSDSSVRAVIITGSGDKAFVAGADIAEFSEYSKEEGEALAREGQEMVFNKIENASKPFIACINGYALGGGLELAMACHMRFASSNAKMGLPEVSLGVIPGYGGTQRLPKLIGKGRAMELISTARMIDATTAANYGLVNFVLDPEVLMNHCLKVAATIANNSPMAISKAIDAINASDTPEGFQTEIEQFGACFETDDFVEGTEAFLGKRKAVFKT